MSGWLASAQINVWFMLKGYVQIMSNFKQKFLVNSVSVWGD